MIVCVLGMHKSGTTLLAESLHHSGIHMADVDASLGYDQSNKYERHEAQQINREILRDASVPTLHGLRQQRRGTDRSGYQRNTDSISLVLQRRLDAALAGTDPRPIRDLVAEVSTTHPSWGFKDPRTCLTYPVWRDALPDHRVVGVYREFDEVVMRYKAAWSSPVRAARVIRSWLLHNERLVDHVQGRDGDVVIVNYATLMHDPGELDRVGRYLDRELIDRRDPDMYRARVDRSTGSRPPLRLPRPVVARIRHLESQLAELTHSS